MILLPTLTPETLMQILTGRLPFFYLRQDTTVIAFVQDGKRPDRLRCLPTIFTDPMWKLLDDCWDKDPKRRPDMGTVVRRLQSQDNLSRPCHSFIAVDIHSPDPKQHRISNHQKIAEESQKFLQHASL